MSLMSMSHEAGVQKLLDIAATANLPTRERLKILNAVEDILQGKAEYEERIQELEEQLLRNPSFPGDFVGWLDDDFTLPDDDDSDDKDT